MIPLTTHERRRYIKAMMKGVIPLAVTCLMIGVIYIMLSLCEHYNPFMKDFAVAKVIAGFFALAAIGSELVAEPRFGGWFQRTAITIIVSTGVVFMLLPILLWQVYQLVQATI